MIWVRSATADLAVARLDIEQARPSPAEPRGIHRAPSVAALDTGGIIVGLPAISRGGWPQ